jgi:hypothetical protein
MIDWLKAGLPAGVPAENWPLLQGEGVRGLYSAHQTFALHLCKIYRKTRGILFAGAARGYFAVSAPREWTGRRVESEKL